VAAVASAADLRATDLGGGRLELSWTHPDAGPGQGITFDVYTGTDPLDPFRSRRLVGHPDTTATLGGFDRGATSTSPCWPGAVRSTRCRPGCCGSPSPRWPS
jgi:hypothetical protein